MKRRPAHLPDYDDPPVIEVALSVQFERLEKLRSPHLGLLWSEFQKDFPLFEDHAPLQSVIETFGVRPKPIPALQLISPETTPLVRCWFLNHARTELIQVQQDRLVHNWRKVGEGVKPGEEYPHFEYICEQFARELEIFKKFVDEHQLGIVLPNQCEVSYINHIVAGKGWETHAQMAEIISVWGKSYSHSFPLEMENAKFSASFPIPDTAGKPIGRLHILMQPAFRKADDSQMFVLTLTARGKPTEGSAKSIIEFLESGREYIVLGFTAITTPKMHRIWGRKDA